MTPNLDLPTLVYVCDVLMNNGFERAAVLLQNGLAPAQKAAVVTTKAAFDAATKAQAAADAAAAAQSAADAAAATAKQAAATAAAAQATAKAA